MAVVFVGADAVGVAFDCKVQALIGEHDAGYFSETLAGSGE